MRIYLTVMVVFLLFLLSNFFVTEVTVYTASCSTAYVNGKCNGIESADSRETFKASYDHQIVVSQVITDDSFSPKQLSRCTVMNSDNWICLGDEYTPIKKLRKGNFQEEELALDNMLAIRAAGGEMPGSHATWRTASKWDWYYLKVCQWLF